MGAQTLGELARGGTRGDHARPAAVTPATERSRALPLRVVSYNIHKGLSADNRRYVLDEIRRRLHGLGADVVLVQEVIGEHARHRRRFTDWPADSQARYLADGEWAWCAYGRNAVYPDGDHGNAVLSHLPIVQWENIDISITPWEQRGLLHAVLELPGGRPPLHLCCLHLDVFQATRRRQLEVLCQRIEAAVPHGAPLIVGGDFNDWRGQATRRLRQRVDLEETFRVLGRRHPRTYPAWNPLLQLDRIYVRNVRPAAARVLTGEHWRRLSDHLALCVDIDV